MFNYKRSLQQIDSLSIGRDGQLHTSLYDKRDDLNFHITNFPFLSSNIPSSPAYGVFISQLIRYARASSSYKCFILRAVRLSNKHLGQGYVKERLRSSLRKFYGQYVDFIKQYEVPLSRMSHDILDDDNLQWHPPLIRHYTNFWPYYWPGPYCRIWLFTKVCEVSIATGAAYQQRTLAPPDTWSCPILDLQMFSCWDHWHSIIQYISLWHFSLIWLFTDFGVITEYRFPQGICNGCGMPTGDVNSSGHLVLSHFGTRKCSNVETNVSWTCLVSGLLSFEHPRYFCFCFNGRH